MSDSKTAEIHTEPMRLEHLDEIVEIETESFAIPWTRQSFVEELTKSKIAIYVVAVDQDGKVAGYGGMWHVVTEGHITNIAVARLMRGKGVADKIMNALTKIALEKEMIGLTLEVRMGNAAAMSLYAKHGFKVEGIRKNYYADTKEDAVIMWKYF